ncbi:hypothetical protein SERLA73DRAFT_190809 [Serpula lacrymans var. lacrymans S7.3]|uniref:Uncharacterized protein n=1 Tax=Serpula lacrymans var. lacrymans (strain S7.3) TaxID=936435 RepID=F8QGF1_SERL3|nr:hypothetical protein SERLA73DRAFT_190809 [Serpula lacrymans var. lacrymans S7.3]
MAVNGPNDNAAISLSESLQMPYLQWEDPSRSDVGAGLSPVAGPSSRATTSETSNARAATMTPPPDWSTLWENYNPEPLSIPIPSVQAQQTEIQWPEPMADPVQEDLDLEYFNSGPNHTNGSTEGLSSSSADSGMQDYLFALFAQR